MAKQLNVSLGFNADVSSAKKNLMELQQTLSSIASTNVSININKELNTAVASAQKLQMHLNNAFNVKTGNLDLSKLSHSLKSSGESLSGLTSGLLGAGITGEKAFLQIHGAIQNANISLTKSQGLLSQFMTTLKNTARWQLSSSLMHGAIGGLQSALGYAKDLDKSLNNIRIVTGSSTEEMAAFAKEANKAAKALNTTTTEYTDASLIYYQQGLGQEEVAKRTDITIKMANAAGQSAQVVSDQLTAVWNNFYNGSESLEYYADVMTALGAATASSTDEIADGLEKFASVADTVGLSYEYAASALATVTATTRQSADVVGTAFKTLFARIEGLKLGETLDDGTTLNKYSEALHTVGIDIFDATGQMKTMDSILDEMGDKWKTLSSDQQMALAQTVAGVRQYTQLISLMDNWDYFEENVNVAKDSEGTLQRQANIYAESWEAASDRARASMEGLFNELIPKELIIDLTDGFASIIDVVADIVNAMGSFKGILLMISSIAVSRLQPDIAQAINLGIDRVKDFKLGWDHVGESVAKAKDLISVIGSKKKRDSRIERRGLGDKADQQENAAYNGVVPGNSPVSQEMSQSLIKASQSEDPLTAGFKDQVASMKQIDTLNNQILQNSRNLTDQEKQQLATQLERLQVMAKSKAEAVDELEILKEQQRLLQEQVAEDFYGDSKFTQINEGSEEVGISLLQGEETELDLNTQNSLQQQTQLMQERLNLKQAEVGTTQLIVEDETSLSLIYEDIVALISNQAAMETEVRDILADESRSVEQKREAIKNVISAAEENKTISHDTAEIYRKSADAIDGTQRSAVKLTSSIAKGNKQTKTFASRLGIAEKNIKTATKHGQSLYTTQKKVNAETAQYNNLWNQATNSLSKSLGRVVSIGGVLSGTIKNITSLASTINTISNAISTISDPDVEWTQKLLSGAMAAGMAVNSLVSITQGLSGAMTALNTVASLNNAINASSLVISGAKNAADAKELINTGLQLAAEELLNGSKDEAMAKDIILMALQDAGIAKDKQEAMGDLLLAGTKQLVAASTGAETVAVTADNAVKAAGTGANLSYALSLYAIEPPILIIIAVLAILLVAVIAVVAAMNAQAEAVKKANEETLKNAKVVQEAIDETQELSESVQDLTKSYRELQAEGKNTSDVLSEMDDKIPQLITSYRELIKTLSGTDASNLEKLVDELEQAYNLAKLTGDYSDFEDKHKEVDEAITQTEYDNARAGGRAGAHLTATDMKDAVGGSIKGNTFKLSVGGSDDVWAANEKNADGTWNEKAEEAIAKDILQRNMGTYYTEKNKAGLFHKSGADLSVDYTDPAAFVDYYEKMQKAQSEMLSTMTEKQLADSDVYREISDALAAGAEHYESMLPLAQAQIEAGGKLAEAAVERELGYAMEDVDTMEEYLEYKEAYIRQAKEFGLSEDQAKVYLDNAEALSRMTDEYALAENMLKNFSGLTDKQIAEMDKETLKTQTENLAKQLSTAFGELSDEQMSIAVSIAATSESIEEFSEKMQQAMIESTRTGLMQSAETASTAMQESLEAGRIDLTSLLNDDNFLEYLEEIGSSATAITAESYEEQYRIISEFHAKVNSMVFDTYSAQQELYYQQVADLQTELANFHRATTGESADAVAATQAEYAKLKSSLSETTDENEITGINNELDAMAEKFKAEYGFEITSNAETLQNELDEILATIDELQNKKIEMAMDWSGVDELEDGYEKAAEFTQMIANDTKKVGNTYQMTASQAREWLEFYPELGKIAEVTSDGLISMNAAEVDAFIAGKDQELDANIETKIAELEAQKAVLQEDLKTKKLELEAAEKLAQGKVELENVSAQYLTELRGNLTQYFMDLGMDEVAANAAALETMGMNEETYSQAVAAACENQATNMEYAAEDGANAQATTLTQLVQRWANFGSYLITNIKPILAEIGKAILDPTRTIGQVMTDAWDASAITVGENGGHNYTTDNGSYTYNSGDATQRTAALAAVSSPQIDSIKASIADLEGSIGSIDGQISYLQALGAGGLEGYGSTDPEEKDKDKNKNKKDTVDEEIDRYHTLNKEIETLEHNLTMLEKKKDKAFGKNKLAYMKQESAELEKMIQKKEALNKAYEADLKSDRAALSAAFTGEKFDKDGNLTNYNELQKQAEAEYNAAITAYNNSNQEDSDQAALDAAKEVYDKKIKLLEQYEETLDGVRQSEEDALAALQEWQTANFEILNYELELKIDINDDRLEMTDYYLSKMEDDIFSMGESLALMTGDKMNSLLATATAYQDQYAKLTEAFEKGEISEADYFAGLDEIKAGLMDSAQAIQELDKQTIEYYANTLTAAQEEIDKYVESMDHLSGVLEHYQTIVDMSTLEKNSESYYKKMDKVMEGQLATAENAVAVAKETMDTFQRELEIQEKAYQDALKSGDEETIKIRQEQYEAALKAANDAEEEYLSRVEDYAEKASEILEYNLKKFANTLEDQLTGGTSFDAMNTGMERFLSLHEEYLTTTNKVYETSKLMRSAQQEIDKTSNTVAKNKMKQFIQETQNLQNQNKLSQFELDIQQAKYDLLVAEIALEEARDAKSQVRLQRDSEGNFGYVYTANQEQVQNAEQEFLDAQNALYNIGLEGANEYVQKYQQTMAEMYDTLTSLAEAYRNGEFESEAEYQAAVQEATEYYYEKLDQYSYLHYQAIQADDRVATDYILSNSNLARTNIHGDTISVGESWRTTFLDISGFGEDAAAALTGQSWDVYQRNKANLGEMKNEALGWKNAVVEYVGNVNGEFTKWKTNISTTVAPAVENLSKKVDAVVTSSNNFKNALTGENGLIKKLQEEIDKVRDLSNKYLKLRGDIHDALLEAEQLMETIIAQKAAAAGVDDPGSNPTTTTNPTTTNPTTNPTTTNPTTTNPTTKPTGNGLSFAGLSKAAIDLLQGLLNAGFAIAVVKEIMDQHNAEPNGKLEDYDAVRTTKQILRSGSGFINIGEHGIVRDTRNFFGTEQAKVEFSGGRKEWVNKDSLTGFATGGYTGNWNGPDGKFALLHQKELVLNKGDTENFLASMEVLDDILKIIDVQSASQLLGRNLSSPTFGAVGSDVLEQNVSIEASFPNATDKQEIEEAFKDLVNLAAQYANRKNK